MSNHAKGGPISLSDRLQPLLSDQQSRVRLDEMVDRIDADDGVGPILFVLTLPIRCRRACP